MEFIIVEIKDQPDADAPVLINGQRSGTTGSLITLGNPGARLISVEWPNAKEQKVVVENTTAARPMRVIIPVARKTKVVTAAVGRAQALREMNRPQEALAAYDEIISQFPKDVVAKVGRAEVLREMNRLDEAMAVYDEIISQFPEGVVAKLGRAEVLREMNRPEAALAAYDEIITQFPEDAVAKAGRAEVAHAIAIAPNRPPVPPVDSDDPSFRFSKSAEQVLRQARALAEKSQRGGVTSSCILFGLAESAGQESNTARFVRDVLSRTGKYDTALAQFHRDSGGIAGQTASEGGPLLGKVSRNVRVMLENAGTIALKVSLPSNEIHSRHIFAALVGAADRGTRALDKPLALSRMRSLGIELATLRQEFREFVRVNADFDNPKAWDAILTPGASREAESNQLEHDFFAGPAGYTSEFCGVGGSEPVPDHLGVMGLAHRLAELIALRETKLPLAVGLFGNWGSGKSHFMNLMDRHMQTLAEETPEDWARRAARSGIAPLPNPNGKGPWCREIVPIYFNAWHYLDTSLWASLVTEIFDRLFRHVAGDADSAEHRKDRIKKLMAELQKANGAAASAEETLELAKAAKAHAEVEEKKASEMAQRAARRRDRLEGWIDGVLDNLEKLLPEGEMQDGWREAVRVLHLEEARKSYALLGAQVAEFQSLQGRARAIGRAVLAPEGRTRRIAWLAGAVLVAPLVVGLGSWVVTSWSVEIRQIGMVIGEVTGLLAGVGAWCGVQLQRGRKLLGQVEELEKAARRKRAAKQEDPMLKRARSELAKWIEKEEQARAQLKEARAKVRRLEEELRELRPERRLFRFIEQRAQAQDYRAHLGLVSLVRRDFHELSCLFAETEMEGQSGILSDEEEKERKEIGASIDRIVLFVDDLDRCQPEKVVDVLQAVHLLLAYPLFAVIVGVDQRCLKQSISKQFQGLISEAKQEGTGEVLATPLDYLEKIFHIPFHLPAMDRVGFGTLIEKLTEQRPSAAVIFGKTEIGQDAPMSPAHAAGGTRQGPPGDIASSVSIAALETVAGDKTQAGLHESMSVIGSVPLQVWERIALKDYHPLIRTPRGATRLLNTYRLVRAGIPAEEWNAFRGDAAMNGEFRVVMLLLASAAGYPALAREWFEILRNTDSTALFLSDEKSEPVLREWMQFKRVYDSTFEHTTPQPTKELFAKWLDRVERFAF